MRPKLCLAIGCVALVIPLTAAQAGSAPPRSGQSFQYAKTNLFSPARASSISSSNSAWSGGGLNNSVAVIGHGGGSGGRGDKSSGNVLVQPSGGGDRVIHRHPVDPPFGGRG